MGAILQRLDVEIATFTDSFTNLVKASRIDDEAIKTSQVLYFRVWALYDGICKSVKTAKLKLVIS